MRADGVVRIAGHLACDVAADLVLTHIDNLGRQAVQAFGVVLSQARRVVQPGLCTDGRGY